MSESRHICVYCSSSDHVDTHFFSAARELGADLGRSGHTLVWGGGRVGLMGELARAVREHGGKVIGVIPESMQSVEIADHDADELVITGTMRQRKQVMDERSDAFVVLPGGFGTLEELSEMLVQKILGYTDRPLVILNTAGFYDPLLELFDHFIEHRFARQRHLDLFQVVTQVSQILPAIDGR